MHPYWIDIDGKLGVGITARSDEDALQIFVTIFGDRFRAAGLRVIRDINELDQGHVAPNMGNWFMRGVWFPLGHEHGSN